MAAKAEQVFLKKFLNRVDPPKKISQATETACFLELLILKGEGEIFHRYYAPLADKALLCSRVSKAKTPA